MRRWKFRKFKLPFDGWDVLKVAGVGLMVVATWWGLGPAVALFLAGLAVLAAGFIWGG